ncbi:MAG: PEP-CTERM sorting domain-containing protein [Thermodesulfobacteriota bacterium]
MKKRIAGFVGGMAVLALAGVARAVPVDLSGFSVLENEPGSVVESGGVVSFTENMSDAALYFYNDFFDVAANAVSLSFDYEFALGDDDAGDYLQFNVDYAEQWFVDGSGGGQVVFDLTPWQGQTISLDWGLIWNGDEVAGSTARIFNIDLAAAPTGGADPVPEPAAMLLFGSGLAGLYGAARRRRGGE